MDNLSCYAACPVFLTGNTGFKGSWLTLWLARLGAHVTGYALAPGGGPQLYSLARIGEELRRQHLSDIRDLGSLREAMQAAQPEIVFHLAAQPLVRASFRDPVDTWSTNLMGTVNLLEAVRCCPSVKAVLVVTTDKCYANREWAWGYRESDRLGGHDPYSASKAATELVAHSYRQAFLAERGVLLATARAGNVIGGGDWSEDRLIPDAARAAAAGTALLVRNPLATRPWQHVLESLHGYLQLGARLLVGDARAAQAFNFGPETTDNLPVSQVLDSLCHHWPELQWQADPGHEDGRQHEARLLYLDSALARQALSWRPVWTLEQALAATAQWYRAVQRAPRQARTATEQQLDAFTA